jgi:predicted nucleic acid-binding Zn finger protein
MWHEAWKDYRMLYGLRLVGKDERHILEVGYCDPQYQMTLVELGEGEKVIGVKGV